MTENSTDTGNQQNKKNNNLVLRILGRAAKIGAYGSLLLLLLVIFILIFIQTSWFDRLAKDYIVDIVNESWKDRDSELHVEHIEGNIFKGLTLMNGSIRVMNDTLIKFSKAETTYDIWKLLNKDIYVHHISIYEPQINLTKVRTKNDSLVWNFEHLLMQEEKFEDTTVSLFDWGIIADDIKIHNGNLRIVADKGEAKSLREYTFSPLDSIDFNNLHIYDFFLDASAQYFPDYKYIKIRNLASNTNSDFNLKKITVEATLDEKNDYAEVKDLYVETARSVIQAKHLRLDDFDPFDNENFFEMFANAPLEANINIKKFYFADIQFWLPVLNFFDNWASVDLEADGTYKDLNIKKLKVITPNSNMNAVGKVVGLDEPLDMRFDIRLYDSHISGGETKILLPGLPIPDYEHVGMVHANATYVGGIYNFTSEFDVRTGSGNARGDLDMDMRDVPRYNLNITTENLDIGHILMDQDLKSQLNVTAQITGSGFDPFATNTKIVYDMNNSTIYNMNINRSAGIVEVRGMNFNVDANINSNVLEAVVKGNINLANSNNPRYNVRGSVKGLDVSQFTKSASDKSNITASFDINGSGTSLNNINGNYRVNFANSFYGDYSIPAGPVNLSINNSGSNGYVNLTSNIVDINAKGSMKVQLVSNVITANLENITEEIRLRTNRDTLNPTVLPARNYTGRNPGGNINFEYDVNVKDPEALAQFLKKEDIYFDGNMKGIVSNSPDKFELSSDFNIKNFSYQDTVLNLIDFNGSIQLSNNYSAPIIYSSFDRLKANVMINGKRLITGGTSYDSVKLDYVLDNSIGNLTASTVQGPERIYYLSGLTDMTANNVAIKIDTMFVKYDQFDITNDGRITAYYVPIDTTENFLLDTFFLKSNFFDLTGQGLISVNGASDLTLEGSGIRVAEVLEFAYPPDTSLYARAKNERFRSPLRGTIRRLYFSYKGNFADPVIGLELNTDLMRYENLRVGRVDAFLDYADNVLTTDMLLSNAQGNGNLRVVGTVPMENPLGASEIPETLKVMTTPLDLRVVSNDFQINFFSKIIPNIGDLRGLMNGQLYASGTPINPLITGGMQFTNGSFFLPATGMYSRFYGQLNAENSDLVLNNFVISTGEDRTAEMQFRGSINTEGLKINDINIEANGSMYVIDETVDNNDFDLYGTLLVRTGEPFTIKGNLSDIHLGGEFLIEDADLELRSLANSPYDLYNDNFVYRLVTDSNFVLRDTVIYVTKDEYEGLDPFMRERYFVLTEEPVKPTAISYDIDVRTLKPAVVQFDISKALKQELFGELEADLNIVSGKTNEMFVYGNVDIVGDSYLRFYRNFQVKNSQIVFAGAASNPTLDIHAVYEVSRAYEDRVAVLLDVTGTAENMEIDLRLDQGGTVLSTDDAQSDAVSYILFGTPRAQLSQNQKNAIGTIGATTGSSYLSAVFSDAIRTIAPFVTSTEIYYEQGTVREGTNIALTSQFGSAVVRVGGRLFSGLSNTEVTVEYPLNRLVNLNLSNRLLFEFFRLADINQAVSSGSLTFTTGVKISYKITF